jgi:hypothetical protein
MGIDREGRSASRFDIFLHRPAEEGKKRILSYTQVEGLACVFIKSGAIIKSIYGEEKK